MYKFIENPKRMNREQIKAVFKGKWVYLAKPEGPPTGWFDTAIPIVVAYEPFEGRETGIYDKLEEEYNGNTTDWTIPPFRSNMVGIFHEAVDYDE